MSVKKELAINAMKKLHFDQKYINDFKEYDKVYFFDGFDIILIDKDTMPVLYDKICNYEERSGALVYGVVREIHSANNILNFLCVNKNDTSINDTIAEKERYFIVVSYGWSQEDNIGEMTLAGIQSCNGGIWCMPYHITKKLSCASN